MPPEDDHKMGVTSNPSSLVAKYSNSNKMVRASSLKEKTFAHAVACTFPGKEVREGELFRIELEFEQRGAKATEAFLDTPATEDALSKIGAALNAVAAELYSAGMLPHPVVGISRFEQAKATKTTVVVRTEWWPVRIPMPNT